MLIRNACLHPYALPLRAEWKTAAGAFAIREGWLLHIETEDGRSGYGDCAPLPDPCAQSGTETAAQAHAALDGYARWLPGHSVGEALQTLALHTLALPGDITLAPAARCAIECALLDLAAQAAGVGLGQFLRGAPCAPDVAVNAALGGLAANSEDAVRKACADGFTVLKLKVGSAPVDADIAHLQRLAALLPADAKLRLDANRAWSESDAAHFLAACAGLPVEQLEEPLADPQPAALARLQAACAFPLALDESGPRDATDNFFAASPLRRLVLKPPRLGGLLPALALAHAAGAAGIDCVVTSSLDSACGILAAAHLAAALGNKLAHGLATAGWLVEDTGLAPRIQAGRLIFPDELGLGFSPYSRAIDTDG